MGDLSDREVEDVLEGVQPPGRDDLAHVVELTSWLHVSREIEPPPAMRDDLFCQIEDGPPMYRRSSRRSPAHLGRPPRAGMRRLVRETLAGSGRPIASVAAAAVLLVGVTLAVRAGGPGREPSAFVSRSAQGPPTADGDPPSTSITVASTTTSPPEAAPDTDAAPTTAPSVERQESSATASTTTEPGSTAPLAAPPDAPPVSNPPARALDEMPWPTDGHAPAPSDDAVSSGSVEDSSGRRVVAPPQSDSADESIRWNLPQSGWSFDLSEWPLAKELWAALGDTEDTEDAVDPDTDDAVDRGDDDHGGDDETPAGDDGPGHDRSGDGGSEPQSDGDPDPEAGRAG
jgi:hypothetical protein